MKSEWRKARKKTRRRAAFFSMPHLLTLAGLSFLALAGTMAWGHLFPQRYIQVSEAEVKSQNLAATSAPLIPQLDKVDYDRRMILLANYPIAKVATTTGTT